MKPLTTTARPASKRTASSPPLEVDALALPPLGMPPAAFLRDYWQKRPLLIRNAFAQFAAPGGGSPIEPEDLAGLACEETSLSRIVTHDRASDGWTTSTGPFAEAMFPGLPPRDWTLLVEDVDKWDMDVARVLEAFAFLPRWRIDDILVSFAAPGGSVGAHVDPYDNFQLQAQGHRRWQVDASLALGRPAPPLAHGDDVELKLLREFHPTHDWVLGPGDMLYLPPGVPHHGVAEDTCLTLAVRMRAPSAAELLGDFVDTLGAEADEALRYHDPDLQPAGDPYEIDAAAMDRAVEALNLLRMNDPDRLGDWFGRFMTVYRNAGEVVPGGDERSRIEVEWDLQRGASLWRHPYSRMAWRKARRGARLYVNGEDFPLPARDARRIAHAAQLDGAAYAALSEAGRDRVFGLIQAGHFRLAVDDGDGA